MGDIPVTTHEVEIHDETGTHEEQANEVPERKGKKWIFGTANISVHLDINEQLKKDIMENVIEKLKAYYRGTLRYFPDLSVFLNQIHLEKDEHKGVFDSYIDYSLEAPLSADEGETLANIAYNHRSAIYSLRRTYITHYRCPDCGWETEEARHRIRCSGCKSLNLERELPDRSYHKADEYSMEDDREHRGFTVHDRLYGWDKKTMISEMGIPPEDADGVWATGIIGYQ